MRYDSNQQVQQNNKHDDLIEDPKNQQSLLSEISIDHLLLLTRLSNRIQVGPHQNSKEQVCLRVISIKVFCVNIEL